MPFPIHLYFWAFVSSLAATALLVPLWRRWCWRTGLVDAPGPRKIHRQPVALAGGWALLSGLALPLLLLAALWRLDLLGPEIQEPLRHAFRARAGQLAGLGLGAVGMLLLGWWDDRQDLRPATKFAGQLLIAALVPAVGIRITLFVPSPLLSLSITLLWILTVTNAFNFMDNMNGLCAGLGLIASLWFGVAAALQTHYLVAGLAFFISGGLLGVLPYNFPRASVFLGDAGSHLIGYLLAVLAILPHSYSPQHPPVLAVFSPVLVLALPLADLAWVVLLRQRRHQPFYQADTNHLSHRLVRRGLRPAQAVLAIWTLAAALGALVLLLE